MTNLGALSVYYWRLALIASVVLSEFLVHCVHSG